MIEELLNIPSTKKDFKNFGITFGLIFLGIGTFLFFKKLESHTYFFLIGPSFIILGFFFPSIIKPFYKAWMGLAIIIGWIMTRIILSVLFFLVMTPIGIFSRLFGKDFLNLKVSHNKSYWNFRNRRHEVNQDYEKQF